MEVYMELESIRCCCCNYILEENAEAKYFLQ